VPRSDLEKNPKKIPSSRDCSGVDKSPKETLAPGALIAALLGS
jgi:hypothetical protein